eukprot:m.90917 g.90917  ORF g.90917 m.90917 type:complete len:2332 (+) comp36671_c0_seq1:91-7086(+)
MELGKPVWFHVGRDYLVYGVVVKSSSASSESVVVQAEEDGKEYSLDIQAVKAVSDVDPVQGVEDMIQLSDLHQGSLLRNIRKRYQAKQIYTYTGSILVAANPYTQLGMYGKEMVRKYEGQLIGKLPPHIFAIGSAAYANMLKTREDQCVVISGESGAGKTESTKLIMQYMAAINRASSNLTTEQILEASPLLESFGNAKTVRNDNSSRFGKYLEINFNRRGVICGAKTTDYLLEKSRIVSQADGERNYHVFYEILVGLSSEDKRKYGLLEADDYFYLNQGDASEITTKDDENDFGRLVGSMEVLGFTHSEKDAIFRILSAVLHLGNVCFEIAVENGQDASLIQNDDELRAVSALLMGPADGFRLSLTHKLTETRGERFRSPFSIEQALDTRDALAKALYSKLFLWLVRRVNSIVDKVKKEMSVAILDIFGFEDFQVNSFEQTCINYANENLQYYFNQHIFKLEQEEYRREGISWKTIDFNDNQPCLDLIAKKPLGLLHILDDESNFPKATDESFLEKLFHQHSNNTYFEKPRTKKPQFAIQHYAGTVWYTVNGFLDKNRDILRIDLIELLHSSSSLFISSLFSDDYETAKSMQGGGRKRKAPTIASKFHESLAELIGAMSRCHPFFVRCIKPNTSKAPMKFENQLVLDQLRYSGMLETIRIRRAGFPVRLRFEAFAKRYHCLVRGLSASIVDGRAVSIQVLESRMDDGYQIGRTKVFLREKTEQKLEEARAIRLRDVVITIQKHLRGFLARVRYRRLRNAVLTIKRWVVAYLARKRFLFLRRSIILLQSFVRMRLQKKKYIEIRDAHRREQEELRRMQAEEEARKRALVRTSAFFAPERPAAVEERVVAIDVTTLEIPPELALVLDSIARGWRHPHTERGLTAVRNEFVSAGLATSKLPEDADAYSFPKFAGAYFQEGSVLGFRMQPIDQPFLKMPNDLFHREAIAIFKMIMRFVGDAGMTGPQEVAVGNYIIQKGIAIREVRDEIYVQLVNQTYGNPDEGIAERGWMLMGLCLSAFPPSPSLYKFLLNYVSDCGVNGYNSFCQHRLLRCDISLSGVARSHPPSMLEWKAARSFSTMVLAFVFPDDDKVWAVIDSWTTAEEIATILMRDRGVEIGVGGFTVALIEDKERHELSGHDFVLDLLSELELPPEFPASPSPGFCTRAYGTLRGGLRHMGMPKIGSPSLARRNQQSVDDNPGLQNLKLGHRKRPALPRAGHYPRLSAAVDPHHPSYGGEPPERDAVTDYLDSLFRPVLSDNLEELADPVALPGRLKGRGGMPPPPPSNVKKPPGAVPLLGAAAAAQEGGGARNAVKNMAAMFAQRRMQKQDSDDSSSSASEPQSNFAGILAARKKALESKGRQQDIPTGLDFRSQLAAKRKNILKSSNDGEILISPESEEMPPPPNFPPPPPPVTEDGVDVGDPLAPSASRRNLADELSAAVTVSVLDASLLPRRSRPVRLVKPIQGPAVMYNRPTWMLTIRKEMFGANEKLDNQLVDLIFSQIVLDTYSNTCCRIGRMERAKMKDLLRRYGIAPENLSQSSAVKKIVIDTAKEWSCYFTKLFRVVGLGHEVRHYTHVGLTHTGVKLIRQHGLELQMLDSYAYGELSDWYADEFSLYLTLNDSNVVFQTNRAPQIAQIIEAQMIALEKEAKYVLAVEDYETHESTLLSFKKGFVIKLKHKDGLDEGWLFGMYEGKTGSFPMDYVHPIRGPPTAAAVEQSRRSAIKKRVSKSTLVAEQSKITRSASFKSKKGREVSRSALDKKATGPMTRSPTSALDDDVSLLGDDDEMMTGRFSMMEFAKEYFRHDKYEMQRKADGSIRGTLKLVGTLRATFGRGTAKSKRKESWSWSNLADLVKFSKFPVQASLLPLPSLLNKLALECFIAIMRFMRDYMSKGKSEADCVYFILKAMRDHEDLRDEVFCQLIKQTTNNKSPRTDSCARGWRLLSICLAFNSCSQLFKPYLEKYLRAAARDSKREFHATAAICLQNLARTFRYGGRKEPPSPLEIKAITLGRFTKRQVVYMPGDVTKILKIKTSTTSRDVIKELCGMMGLTLDEDLDEYGLFADMGKNVLPVSLPPSDYVLDFTNELERHETECWLYFKKTIWFRPQRLDNPEFINLLYNQVLPDFMRGNLIVLENGEVTPAVQSEVAMLAALIHRANNATEFPSTKEVQKLIPAGLGENSRLQLWVKIIHEHFEEAKYVSPGECKAQFIEILKNWQLFGSRFFPVKNVSDQRVSSDCLLAVNKDGVHFLKAKTRETFVSYPFNEVVSTRRLRSSSGRRYLDLKCGNLMVHRVTRLETLYGLDIADVINVYIDAQVTEKQKQEEAAGVVRPDAIDI